MATSGSTDFTSTEQEIIADAFYTLNVYGSEESISAADYSLGRRYLNRMIKAWQAADLHLWLKDTATIFLQKDQRVYELYSQGDHATLSYQETTLDFDYASGSSTFIFSSAISVSIGDYLGIELDSGELYWDTIKTIIDPISVEINGSIPSSASEGLVVYTYQTKLDEPFNVYSAVRESKSEIDVPMNYLSYEEYFQLPNKTSSATPVSYNYDRQLGKALITVWPVPQNVQYLMKVTMSRKLEDFISNPNTPDFPQEWHEALVTNLAVKMAHSFGRTGTPRFQDLEREAAMCLERVMNFDSEQGSIFLQPDFRGQLRS